MEVTREAKLQVFSSTPWGCLSKPRVSDAPPWALGVKKIMRVRPHKRPKKVERSRKPRFHAIKDSARQRMREAYAAVLMAYLIASERLKAGDRDADFPEGTFPPGLPFVPFTVRCRGQPA